MTDTYLTVAGDMWDSIAHKVYGSSAGTGALMERNRALVDIVVFPAGVTLELPELERPAAASLPPWKRGKGAAL